MKILVSAYACEPNRGSEPGVGWNWAKLLAKFSEVWVITRSNNRAAIDDELAMRPVSALHFVYYDVPRWLSFWKRKGRGLYLYYLLWQIGAYLRARKVLRNIDIKAVHHLTFGNLWLPTFMPLLGIPFVWGPVGGGEQIPRVFRKDYTISAKVQELFRDIILHTLRINPFFLLAYVKADLILARTHITLNKLRLFGRHKNVVKMIETGVEKSCVSYKSIVRNKRFLQIISVGRLIHCKGFDLALKAFAKAFHDSITVKMIIVGDGPDRRRLNKITERARISDKVDFVGYVQHSSVLEYMSKSSILLQPSLKEGGAWVLYEAMMEKLPIVCLDIAGASEIVTDKCGVKIAPDTPAGTVQALASALLRLAHNPGLRRRMGEAGRRRMSSLYCWNRKAGLIRELYERL